MPCSHKMISICNWTRMNNGWSSFFKDCLILRDWNIKNEFLCSGGSSNNNDPLLQHFMAPFINLKNIVKVRVASTEDKITLQKICELVFFAHPDCNLLCIFCTFFCILDSFFWLIRMQAFSLIAKLAPGNKRL